MSIKFEIPIYPDEAALEAQILKASVVSSLAQLRVVAPFSLPTNLEKLIASERKNVDLHYLHSVLVSSVWNDNDELFLASELWHSRNTPKDKQFNYEHSEDDIIGHMTNSYVIDEAGAKIEETTNINDLPDVIHIFNQAVLYKHWVDKDKQERMDKIIEELPEGKWFVSVECLLPDFDYALKDKKGNIELISRNKKTSFLTKYLRLFGGEGLYDGKRIARVPRNFIISGKGLVKNPANKGSIIIAKKMDLETISNNQVDIKIDSISVVESMQELIKNEISSVLKEKIDLVYNSSDPINKKVIKMDNTKELEYQAEIKKLTENFQKLQASLNEVEVNKIKVELDEIKKTLDSKNQEVEILKASVEKAHAEKTEVSNLVDELTKSKNALEKQIADINENERVQKRLTAAKSFGLSDDEAKLFIAQTNKMTDEDFEKHIDFQKKFMSKNSKVTETVVEIVPEKVITEIKAEASLIVNSIDKKADNEKVRQAICDYMSKNHIKQANPKFAKETK